MANVCPKPCGRLATAAFFIVIGVIQFLVGVILLRSKYADLLSGPDFLTASSNVGVGCVYGVLASIYGGTKQKSFKKAALRNVLSALLLSVMVVNSTAAFVLIMGEGNKLLSIHLENNIRAKADFANEILAYAYIASVCSPITCIVVAIVALSGRLFDICRDTPADKQINIATDDYNWVFDPKVHKSPVVVSDLIQTPTSSSSGSKDSVFSEMENTRPRRKSILSLKNIPSPVNTWKQKRERLIKGGLLSQSQPLLDSYLENSNFDEYGPRRFLPRIQKSSLKQNSHPKVTDASQSLVHQDNTSKFSKSILKRNSSNPVPRKAAFTNDVINCEQPLSKKHSRKEVQEKTGSTYSKTLYDKNRDEVDVVQNYGNKSLKYNKSASSNGNIANRNVTIPDKSLRMTEMDGDDDDIYTIDPVMSELKAETLKELKQRVQMILPGASIAIIKLPNDFKGKKASNPEDSYNLDVIDSTAQKEPSNVRKFQETFSENVGSSCKPLLSDESSKCGHAPSDVNTKSTYSASPYKNKAENPDLSKTRSKSLYFSHDSLVKYYDPDENGFSSMKTVNSTNKSCPSSPKAGSRRPGKKFDASRKMSMASISEVPNEDDIDYYSEPESPSAVSNFDVNSYAVDENSNIKGKMSPSSRRIYSLKAAKRKSSNSLLKRMWSSSEAKLNVSNMVVDEDSLIGLSEDDLIARTLRIRSLRKTVEERLKRKKEAEKKMAKEVQQVYL
ncbi:uncharacterized protein CEXT_200491 [Caerostris extrusa]|uniref:Uncharacterized protein n=1 Tax=Caerostris extrusa TaxID=172846 RepID=A0AAV4N2Q8_CAEEX|nr:uncharacterized protein CEXT_200491 [Caerostris extrusa]